MSKTVLQPKNEQAQEKGGVFSVLDLILPLRPLAERGAKEAGQAVSDTGRAARAAMGAAIGAVFGAGGVAVKTAGELDNKSAEQPTQQSGKKAD